MAVRVELHSEIPTSYEPAKILIYENGLLIKEIIAYTEPKPGADGGFYNCVILRERK